MKSVGRYACQNVSLRRFPIARRHVRRSVRGGPQRVVVVVGRSSPGRFGPSVRRRRVVGVVSQMCPDVLSAVWRQVSQLVSHE